MTQLISVGVNQHAELLMRRLDTELRNLHQVGIPISIEVNNQGDFTFFVCNGNREVYQSYLSKALADLIIMYWEPEIILQTIYDQYYYFKEDDKKQIYLLAKKYMYQEGFSDWDSKDYVNQRKNHVWQRILDYFDTNSELIVDGFIRFRLKDYLDEIQQCVDRAVDDFLIEREYQEFIKLLKYFVDVQEPRIDVVQIVLGLDDTFHLFDKNQNKLEHDYLDGLLIDLGDNKMAHEEDLLVSALITLAPQQIILHLQESEKLYQSVDTIKQVFESRVTLCHGCKFCNQINKH